MPRMIDSPSSIALLDNLPLHDGSLVQETPFVFSLAIQYYDELEERCDAAIQEQDDLIRAVALRCRGTVMPDPDPAGWVSTSGAQFPDEPPLAPMVSAAMATQATPEEIASIEALEFDIIQLRQRMHIVEKAIAGHTPLTPTDTARKLKFLARLIADGGEVDMDAFAQLVEAGADMLLKALGEVGYNT